jgi:glutathione synthase/RimK-type ligase-like ATP-grasp enzyme
MNLTTDRKTEGDIALLTDHRYAGEARPGDWYHAQMLEDDRLLAAELEKRGLRSVRLDWARPETDWSRYRALVLRTTWDYYDRFAEFSEWLNRVKYQTRIINPVEALEWNMHKSYLPELERRGIPVVPVRMIAKGSGESLAGLLDETGWEEAVIKPAVSGGARLTFRLNKRTAPALDLELKPHLEQEDFLLQPYMNDIAVTGEDTLMVFGDRYTHAVRKKAKKGDFRVQDDHGGTVQHLKPTPQQIMLALKAMKAAGFRLAYGRVDMVKDHEGRDRVMELEIVEPELWLRYHPESAAAFADEIMKMAD